MCLSAAAGCERQDPAAFEGGWLEVVAGPAGAGALPDLYAAAANRHDFDYARLRAERMHADAGTDQLAKVAVADLVANLEEGVGRYLGNRCGRRSRRGCRSARRDARITVRTVARARSQG